MSMLISSAWKGLTPKQKVLYLLQGSILRREEKAGRQSASIAPVKLSSYRIHDNPPGISGALVEGRFKYDAFVLENKAVALYYHKTEELEPEEPEEP